MRNIYWYLDDKNEKILDVGCGYGRYSRLLISDLFSEVYGIDLFDTISFEDQGFHYYQTSKEKLSFENDFLILFMPDQLFIIPVIAKKTISEWNRVLKPGGLILLSGHTKYSIYTLFRRIKRKFNLRSVEHLQGVKFYSTGYYKNINSKWFSDHQSRWLENVFE